MKQKIRLKLNKKFNIPELKYIYQIPEEYKKLKTTLYHYKKNKIEKKYIYI